MKTEISNHYAFVQPDGRVAILYLIEGKDLQQSLDFQNADLDYKLTKNDLVEINPNTIPKDRYFRDAWKLSRKQIAIDLNKAKTIHTNKLRLVRDEILQKLDIEYTKANEQGKAEEAEIIAAKKQELRDMPKNISYSGCATPDDVRAVLPECLKNG